MRSLRSLHQCRLLALFGHGVISNLSPLCVSKRTCRTARACFVLKERTGVALYASGQHPRQARWSAAKRSGSNGGLGLLVRLPIPRKQVGDLAGGMIGKPGQDVSEPSLRIDVVHLAGFDPGIDGGGTMAASV